MKTQWVCACVTSLKYGNELLRPGALDMSSRCSHMVSSCWKADGRVETCSSVYKRDIVCAASAICCNRRPSWLKYALRSPGHSWWHTTHTLLISSPQVDYRPGSVFVSWFILVVWTGFIKHVILASVCLSPVTVLWHSRNSQMSPAWAGETFPCFFCPLKE